jgi:hypothetical protein
LEHPKPIHHRLQVVVDAKQPRSHPNSVVWMRRAAEGTEATTPFILVRGALEELLAATCVHEEEAITKRLFLPLLELQLPSGKVPRVPPHRFEIGVPCCHAPEHPGGKLRRARMACHHLTIFSLGCPFLNRRVRLECNLPFRDFKSEP